MIKDGWYWCDCGKRLFRLLPTTILVDHVAFCPRCKRENIVSTIYKAECTYSDEPIPDNIDKPKITKYEHTKWDVKCRT